ncbi:MAG TPA: hypothetical protein VFS86_11795 [Rhodanobacteraceae bacterium]|nr:hypothetical protein [Rhodanobacteraceae bacterium]
MTRITASAPGKLALLGEYAVLEGAPALVLAVNRRAHVRLADSVGGDWEIVSPTLELAARLPARGDVDARREGVPGELAWVAQLLGEFGRGEALPPCRVELESDAFYFEHAGARAKLGLGSSAALTVALLGALHARANRPPVSLDTAIAAHRGIQHGRGSGIDIAASLAGGLSRFQLEGDAAHVAPLAWPSGLHWRCVYSGRPASTGAMLAAVAAWREREPAGYAQGMHELATISSRGINALAASDAAAFLSSFHAYADALARFGESAGVDIASREHRAIAAIAADCGCVYKSCGAGNGDVGITLGVEDGRLREFARRASRAGFPVIDLSTDPAGLAVASVA